MNVPETRALAEVSMGHASLKAGRKRDGAAGETGPPEADRLLPAAVMARLGGSGVALQVTPEAGEAVQASAAVVADIGSTTGMLISA